MAKSGTIAERYATALFSLAGDRGQLDAVAADLLTVGGMLAESADLRALVHNPLNRRADQALALVAIGQRAGLTETTLHFLGVLAKRRRIADFTLIAEAYRLMLARLRGEHMAEVTSATALRPGQVEALRERLAAKLGGAVHLFLRVDPSLLGGLVVRVGSRMVDSSLRGKLDRLNVLIKGTV